MPVWTDPELNESAMVKALHGWWTQYRGPSGLPDRDDFDVFGFRNLLPNLMIADIEPEPFRVRYRLVGTYIVANVGTDFTGMYLDELIGPNFDIPWEEYYRTATFERRPVLGRLTEPTNSGGTFTYEFGLFPISVGRGNDVRQCISVEDYFDFSLRSGALFSHLAGPFD